MSREIEDAAHIGVGHLPREESLLLKAGEAPRVGGNVRQESLEGKPLVDEQWPA